MLQLNFFSIGSLLKNKADDKCGLKFGTERIKVTQVWRPLFSEKAFATTQLESVNSF